MTWMAWTPGTALIVGALVLIFLGMSLWHALEPKNEARGGVLGFATQRGDRLVVALIVAAIMHLGWAALAPAELPLWMATLVSAGLAGVLLRWG